MKWCRKHIGLYLGTHGLNEELDRKEGKVKCIIYFCDMCGNLSMVIMYVLAPSQTPRGEILVRMVSCGMAGVVS